MKKLLLTTMGICLFFSTFAQNAQIAPKENSNLIKSIYFGGGSDWITPDQVEELKKFIKDVPDLEQYQISISSFTDNIGGKEYNEWLSKMRSESVLRELNELDIPDDRVYIEDNGQIDPYYDNRTHKGRMANRRVDVVLTLIVY